MNKDYPIEWNDLPKKERKQKIKDWQKKRQARDRQIQKLKQYGVPLGIFVLIIGLWWQFGLKNAPSTIAIEGVEEFTNLERNHVDGNVAYQQSPPVGGPHNPVWVACNGDEYEEPVPNEQAVHALEHGAVWITYKPDTDQDSVESLKSKVKGYTFMSPYENQESPITLTAWGNQLKIESTDDPRIDQFLEKFRQGAQTPEPGATCNAVPGGMS